MPEVKRRMGQRFLIDTKEKRKREEEKSAR
jgi:hypothetical protein